jgi:anti-sigma-K factor RskA
MTSTDHEALRSQIGAYVLDALEPAEKAEVQAHLAACLECASEARALQSVTDSFAWSVAPVEPPPTIRERVLSAIATSRTRSAAPARRSPAPWLAAAASLVIAAGLGVYATQLRGRIQSLESQLSAAIAQLQLAQQQTAQARLVAADAQRGLSVLAAPDVAHVDLKGQTAAPQASARALWSRSRGLLFAASNLPAPPPGRTYQLWILSGRQAPISDGWVFKTDADGAVTTMFNTSATIPPPTAMAVTLEPEGGTPAPTGAMYLVGSLN